MSLKPESTTFPIIQALRGIAALSVCWSHLTQSIALFPEGSWISLSGRYGWLGVQVFFVISGFIVPYSLWRGGYSIKCFFVFLWKRIVRVDPPYFVSLALAVAIAVLAARSSLYVGRRPDFSLAEIAFHLGYLIPFVKARGYDWIVGAYWTLGVEFQYYVTLALLFPLIASRSRLVRLAVYVALCMIPFFLPAEDFLPRYMPLFLMGISGMLRRIGITESRELWLTIGIATTCGLVTMGPLETGVGAATIACIMNLERAPIALLVVGDISYSLYLIHQPIGGRVVNLGGRFVPAAAVDMLPFAALAIVLLLSYAMYTFVERPAKRWAGGFRYRPPLAGE
jgi:peptidoglycan/LPS O-acetylase OafA/YrhL